MNFGLIGCGFISKKHIDAMKKINGILVASCDIDFARAQQTNAHRFYTDYRTLLQDKEISVVSVATPNYLHPQIAIEALDLGKKVILEKPVGISVSTLQTLLEHKLANNVAICYQRRFDEDCQRIKNSAKKITQIDAKVLVRRDPEYWNTWRSDIEKSGGGNLINIDIHFLDIIQWWLGGIQPVIQFAKIGYRGGIDQFVHAELNFSGVPVKFTGSSLHNERTIDMKVYYEDGSTDVYNKETATHYDIYNQFLNHNNYCSVQEAVKSLQIVEDIYKFDKENG